MITLSIETSTLLGGIAIADDKIGLIAENRLNVKTTHSERLMPEIDHILKMSSLKIKDIDFFSISIGPGSFTGLRVGLSTVKGLSFSTGKPIVAVPTLEAFAWNFPYCRYPICIMLDARKKEVYTSIFLWSNYGFKKILSEASITLKELIKILHENIIYNSNTQIAKINNINKILFAGEGAFIYKDVIINNLGKLALFAPPDKMVPSPANVAILGLQKAKKGEFSDPISVSPFYIRKSEAELKSI